MCERERVREKKLKKVLNTALSTCKNFSLQIFQKQRTDIKIIQKLLKV